MMLGSWSGWMKRMTAGLYRYNVDPPDRAHFGAAKLA
jgi:hypothetical protein